MTVSSEELELIKTSFDRLREQFDVHSMYFYESLFRHAPHLREMFREDLAGQGMKFMTTLGVIIEKLDDEAAIAEQYIGLGKKHAILGVRARHFEPMREALIDTMRNALGKDFDYQMELAWRHAFDQVAENMIERGNISDD